MTIINDEWLGFSRNLDGPIEKSCDSQSTCIMEKTTCFDCSITVISNALENKAHL